MRSFARMGLLVVATCASTSWADEPAVGITDSMPYLDVFHDGRKVRIQRIPDVQHRLEGELARTSRPCPPDCIRPMRASPGVETVGELELLEFIDPRQGSDAGVLVDARLPEYHRLETLPTAANIPFSVLRAENPHIDRILLALGARKIDGRWNFDRARPLMVFCNGPWSDQSTRAISALLGLGYPAARLRYYRGGLQAWRLAGLTTVVPAGLR